jgi:hypothetical protein
MLESLNKDLQLKTVVAAYGFPEYVKPYDCREGNCATILVYPDIGMLVGIYITNNGGNDNPQLAILPDTTVDRVSFIEPGMENFQKMSIFQYHGSLMDWKEYGKYP